MVSIRKALASDFEEIYILIHKTYKNTSIPKDDWRKLFIGHWCEPEDSFGYVIIDNDRIKGFLSTIFSYRLIGDSLQKFCNLSTWVVSKDYRNYSIGLLFKGLKIKNTTITVFTPSQTAGEIYRGLGFKEIENKIIIVPPPVLSFRSVFTNCKIEFKRTVINKYLNNEEKRILNDHERFNIIYLLIKSKEGCCFIIARRTKIKFLAFARIHYISNLTVFLKYYGSVCLNVALKFRVLGLIVEGRYLQNCKDNKYLIHRKLPHSIMYKSDIIQGSEIDTLFSEFFLFNIEQF